MRCASRHPELESLPPTECKGCGTNVRARDAGCPSIGRDPDHSRCAAVLGALKDESLRWVLTHASLTTPARAGDWGDRVADRDLELCDPLGG